MFKKTFIFGLLLFVFSVQLTGINARAQSLPCDYPASILDLTNWKQTLPIGSSGKPTEITQPSLATYFNDPYFVVNSECNGVRFRAPVNGVTTSGSSYPRSELREMTNNGTTNASWATNVGVHTMFIDQAITAVPITKKHVVAGQIHDSSDDVIVIRLEYPKLFVDINGKTGPTLDANYVLGKRFTVKFVASEGKINIFYNDSVNPVYTLDKIVSGNYFKAGAYTQSNCSKELSKDCIDANYGEVIIYNVWTTHSLLPTPTPTPVPVPSVVSLATSQNLINTSKRFSEGYTPEKLWDGCYEGLLYNADTCTTGGRDISSFWLEFDFKDLYKLSQARLYGDAEGTWSSKTWKLSYKKNIGDSWTTAFSGQNAFYNKWSTRNLNFTARYVRVEVMGNKDYSPGRTQARELEIYGTPVKVAEVSTVDVSKTVLGNTLEGDAGFTERFLGNKVLRAVLIVLIIFLIVYLLLPKRNK